MTVKYTRNVNLHLRYVNFENAWRDLSNHALLVMIGPKLWELLTEVGADGQTHEKKRRHETRKSDGVQLSPKALLLTVVGNNLHFGLLYSYLMINWNQT